MSERTLLRIICWSHRRAVDPLLAALEGFHTEHPGIEIKVDQRPLSDFEHQGIDGVARAYDMVIYDHPFSGDIAKGEVFLPLEKHFPDLFGEQADRNYVGASLTSYRYRGSVWGAPIDAATQHALVRQDLLDAAGEAVPKTWAQAVALGERLQKRGLKLGLSVETPHALLAVAALMANQGQPWSTAPDQAFTIDRAAFKDGLQWVRRLLAFCPPEALGWNSIDLHEAMVARDDIAYCPCVYGYATYGEADMRKPLAFADFAGLRAPYHAGSAIGGTALGVSRYSKAPQAALAFVAYMVGAHIQDRTIPENHGQPALVSSWERKENDAIFNGFYSSVRASMDSVWVRPRMPGYAEFQRDAGNAVAAALRGELDDDKAIDEVLRLAGMLNP